MDGSSLGRASKPSPGPAAGSVLHSRGRPGRPRRDRPTAVVLTQASRGSVLPARVRRRPRRRRRGRPALGQCLKEARTVGAGTDGSQSSAGPSDKHNLFAQCPARSRRCAAFPAPRAFAGGAGDGTPGPGVDRGRQGPGRDRGLPGRAGRPGPGQAAVASPALGPSLVRSRASAWRPCALLLPNRRLTCRNLYAR